MQLPFDVALGRDTFQRKMDKLFQGLANVIDIVDDTFIAGFIKKHTDHDTTLNKVLRICR